MKRATRLLAGVWLIAGLAAAQASAAELQVLSSEELRTALQELAPAFEKASEHKLKIVYVKAAEVPKKVEAEDEYDVVILDQPGAAKLTKAAKLVGGSTKVLFKASDVPYTASTAFQSEQPVAAKALIDFLAGAQAKEVYKAKGLQPG